MSIDEVVCTVRTVFTNNCVMNLEFEERDPVAIYGHYKLFVFREMGGYKSVAWSIWVYKHT